MNHQVDPAISPAPGAEPRIRDEDVQERLRFLDFSDEDIQTLKGIHGLAERYADEVIDEFYRHLMAFDVGHRFLGDPNVLERVKRAQKSYFLRLTQGDYGKSYVDDRLSVGLTHARVDLPVKSYLGMYGFYLKAVAQRVFTAFGTDFDHALKSYLSLLKIVFFDIGLTIDTYIYRREHTIRLQQDAIRELSTPVLQVREGLLILPIIGLMDSARSLQLTSQLLNAIRNNRARVVVIDITGVPAVDSRVANHLVQTVEAARLMGANAVVTGISPQVAQALVVLGVDLSNMNTAGDLQSGLAEAERSLGFVTVRLAPEEDEHRHSPCP